MVDAVETMAWKGETPWHGLGTKFTEKLTVPEMLQKAKLDWSVSLRKMQFADKDGTFEGDAESGDVTQFSALVRDSDNSVLDVVGSRWQPTQNAEAFEFFNEFVNAGDAEMNTAGSLRGGRMVWGLADLKREFSLGKDNMKAFLLLALPHEQGKSIRALMTNIRVVCWNTLTWALKEGSLDSFRMSHRRVFDKNAQDEAKQVLGIAREEFDKQKEIIEKIAKVKMSQEESLKFIAEVIEPSLLKLDIMEVVGTRKAPKNFLLAADSLKMGPGATLPSANGTLWGAVNAITFATDHLFGAGQDQRLTKAWFGTTANLKRDALQLAAKKAKG